jgi:hypothetical protein
VSIVCSPERVTFAVEAARTSWSRIRPTSTVVALLPSAPALPLDAFAPIHSEPLSIRVVPV